MAPRLSTETRYLAIAVAAVVVASYLVTAALVHFFPFPENQQGVLQSLAKLLPGDQRQLNYNCHVIPSPTQWSAPGLVQGLHCTEPSLKGGNFYAYQLNSYATFQTAWNNFNNWWGFLSASAEKTCPPTGSQGMVVSSTFQAEVPTVLECSLTFTQPGILPSATYVWAFPISDSFVIAEAAAANGSFVTLVNWLNAPPQYASPISYYFASLGATEYTCPDQNSINSSTSGSEVPFIFFNDSKSYLRIGQLDNSTGIQVYHNVQPGRTYSTDSIMGQAWIVANPQAKCLAIFDVHSFGQVMTTSGH